MVSKLMHRSVDWLAEQKAVTRSPHRRHVREAGLLLGQNSCFKIAKKGTVLDETIYTLTMKGSTTYTFNL